MLNNIVVLFHFTVSMDTFELPTQTLPGGEEKAKAKNDTPSETPISATTSGADETAMDISVPNFNLIMNDMYEHEMLEIYSNNDNDTHTLDVKKNSNIINVLSLIGIFK